MRNTHNRRHRNMQVFKLSFFRSPGYLADWAGTLLSRDWWGGGVAYPLLDWKGGGVAYPLLDWWGRRVSYTLLDWWGGKVAYPLLDWRGGRVANPLLDWKGGRVAYPLLDWRGGRVVNPLVDRGRRGNDESGVLDCTLHTTGRWDTCKISIVLIYFVAMILLYTNLLCRYTSHL